MSQARLTLKAILLLLVAFNNICAGAAENQKSVNFSLSGVGYKFELPKSYCTPTGKDIKLMDTVASWDSRNMTHFTIVPCTELGRDTNFTRWGMLKTPRASIGKRIPTRQSFIRDFERGIKRRELGPLLADAAKLAGKTFNDVFGPDVKLGMHMEQIDADEYAGYMGGTLSVSVADQNMLTACVSAMTVVRENVFFYYKYAPYKEPSDIAELLKQVKPEIRKFVIGNRG